MRGKRAKHIRRHARMIAALSEGKLNERTIYRRLKHEYTHSKLEK